MTPALLTTILGGVLIVAGICLVVIETFRWPLERYAEFRDHRVDDVLFTPWIRFRLWTTSSGLMLVGIGAVLAIAGAVIGAMSN